MLLGGVVYVFCVCMYVWQHFLEMKQDKWQKAAWEEKSLIRSFRTHFEPLRIRRYVLRYFFVGSWSLLISKVCMEDTFGEVGWGGYPSWDTIGIIVHMRYLFMWLDASCSPPCLHLAQLPLFPLKTDCTITYFFFLTYKSALFSFFFFQFWQNKRIENAIRQDRIALAISDLALTAPGPFYSRTTSATATTVSAGKPWRLKGKVWSRVGGPLSFFFPPKTRPLDSGNTWRSKVNSVFSDAGTRLGGGGEQRGAVFGVRPESFGPGLFRPA